MSEWCIRVDPALCIGSGICVGSTSRYFTFGDNHRSRPVDPYVKSDAAVLDAVASCPVGAIHVADAETGAPVEFE